MDIHLRLQLGLNTSRYRLSQSPPPHTIIEWIGRLNGTQPTDAELQAAYDEWVAANPESDTRSCLRSFSPTQMAAFLSFCIPTGEVPINQAAPKAWTD